MNEAPRREALIECVRSGGRILREFFGRIREGRTKESASSIVTDADLAAERWIVDHLRRHYPEDGIIAEESGFHAGASGFTWVIDPLDGTSNFVAGLPWFGVQIGVLQGTTPVLSAMYLPLDDKLYLAEAGKGAFLGNQRLAVTEEPLLRNVLCAFGFDASSDAATTQRSAELLARVAGQARNVRATNSLIDFCYTLEGRFGGCITLNAKIWDIVPVALMLPEAGGRFTDLAGRPLVFDIQADTFGSSYATLGGTAALHPQLAALTRPWVTNVDP